jgi:hypothetical protein
LTTATAYKPTELEEAIASFAYDPIGYVYFNFPWGEKGTVLEFEEGPDEWQLDVLKRIGKGLPLNEAIREAVRSGHGIGKSALIAWIIKFIMDTRPFPQIVVTANTKLQLEAKTWRELAKWHNLSRTKAWCKHTSTKFYRIEHESTWFAMLVPWTKEKSEAFAGTHEKHVLIIYDEASAIDDVIWEVTEGAMTGKSEGDAITKIWIAFGNPTRNTGAFSRCFKKDRHRWHTTEIDSRNCKMSDKDEIQAWIDAYGEDSDFVRVRVKGQEPRAGFLQFIGADLVEAAMQRTSHPSMYHFAPKIMGVDIARSGEDQTVIKFRQGVVEAKPAIKLRKDDAVYIANLIKQQSDEWRADAVILDMGNIGAAIRDICVNSLHMDNVLGVWFGSDSSEEMYYNKRAQMWGRIKEWLQNGGVLIDDPEMLDDLCGPEVINRHDDGKIQLESKKDMKKRGLPSPDNGDAWACTFAFNVERRDYMKEAVVRAGLGKAGAGDTYERPGRRSSRRK